MRKSVKKELAVAGKMLKNYVALHDSLFEAGIVRSDRGLVTDYGEWLASKYLNLRFVGKTEKGYDAKDSNGKRYEIKSRAAPYKTPIFSFRRVTPKEFDYAVFVRFSPRFDLREMAVVPHATVKKYIRTDGSNYRFNFNNKIRKDPTVRFIKILS